MLQSPYCIIFFARGMLVLISPKTRKPLCSQIFLDFTYCSTRAKISDRHLQVIFANSLSSDSDNADDDNF